MSDTVTYFNNFGEKNGTPRGLYSLFTPTIVTDKQSLPHFIPGVTKSSSRGHENLEIVTAICLDLDNCPIDSLSHLDELLPFFFIAYTTYSHKLNDENCYRVVVPIPESDPYIASLRQGALFFIAKKAGIKPDPLPVPHVNSSVG